MQPLVVVATGPGPARRAVLRRRVQLLVGATITYNVIEAVGLAMAAPTREIPDDYRITNCSERVVAFILSTVGRHKQWSGLR